jgi:hypothetical protein
MEQLLLKMQVEVVVLLTEVLLMVVLLMVVLLMVEVHQAVVLLQIADVHWNQLLFLQLNSLNALASSQRFQALVLD